ADLGQIRWLANTAINDNNWDTGHGVASFTPQAGNTTCCFDVDSLQAGHTYYFGIRTRQNSAWSKVSNSPGVTTHSSGSNPFCDDGSIVVSGGGGGGAPSGP